MNDRNPIPHIEVLPHPVEVAIDTARKIGDFVMSVLVNTNVQKETDLKTSNYIKREWQPQLPLDD